MSVCYVKIMNKIDEMVDFLLDKEKYDEFIHNIMEDRLKNSFIYYTGTNKLSQEEIILVSYRLNSIINIGVTY